MIDKDFQDSLQVAANLVVVGKALVEIGQRLEKMLEKREQEQQDSKETEEK